MEKSKPFKLPVLLFGKFSVLFDNNKKLSEWIEEESQT